MAHRVVWLLASAMPIMTMFRVVQAIDNGVASTPPRGWCSWQRYRCHIACNDSTSPYCFNERLIKDTADAMVDEGYLDAGYDFVALDDCWQAPQRVNGHIVSDPHRFPSGIKSLADYVHSKGLKFGLYTAVGNNSCAAIKYAIDPLGLGCDNYSMPDCARARLDIDDMVSWGIDHLKVDGCNGFDYIDMNGSYAIIGGMLQDAAQKLGRSPIVYHPSNLGFKFPRQFRELAAIANQWRYFNDIQDEWSSIQSVVNVIGAGQPNCIPGPLPANCTTDKRLTGDANIYCASFCVERDQYLGVAGRGGWHDPDQLLVGQTDCPDAEKKFTPHSTGMQCNPITHDEEQLQMALWSMAEAPLFMSNHVPDIPEKSKQILQNKEVLALNSDPLGRMSFRYAIDSSTGIELWRKELVGGDVAVAIANMANQTVPAGYAITMLDAGFSTDTRVAVRDLFAGQDLGWFTYTFTTKAPINPHGVLLLRLSYSPQYKVEL